MTDPQSTTTGGGKVNRRLFIAGAAAGAVAGGAAVWTAGNLWHPHTAGESPVFAPPGKDGLPGRYPGRVVEIHHPKAASGNIRNREAVKAMLDRGLKELVGADNGVEAWRSFFHK